MQQPIQNLVIDLTSYNKAPSEVLSEESAKPDEVDDLESKTEKLPNQDLSFLIENSNNKQINENLKENLSRNDEPFDLDSPQILNSAQDKSVSTR